jgi:hypothetical protein
MLQPEYIWSLRYNVVLFISISSSANVKYLRYGPLSDRTNSSRLLEVIERTTTGIKIYYLCWALVVHSYNPSYLETDIRRIDLQGQSKQIVRETPSSPK